MEEQKGGRHSAVVDAVREMEAAARDDALLAVGATSRSLARRLGVTETTALRYLRETIAAGHLVEVGHIGRKLLLPWPAELASPPERWATGEVSRGTFRLVTSRETGPAMAKIRFVFAPERLKQVMDKAVAEEAAKAAEQRAKDDADEAVEQAVFAENYPALAVLLSRLQERVPPVGSARGVRFYAEERPEGRVRGRVTIEMGDAHFDALEEILRTGLRPGAE
ncbi:hypothetical protein AB0F77_05590 [Streptomyces sp. NPDC026672]|uniref:hypothetical protein n=1 Tax=unclassified Streptomyces TaxID=2593676 RepID=UPI0034109D14